jgi:ribosomal protein S27AE
MAALRARLRVWLEAVCWAVLTWLGAECPRCASPVADTLRHATRHCDICGKKILGIVLRQHDGRYICQRHKAGVR